MKKIGIIHTTPATIATLKALVQEHIEDAEVINILDDSILGDMRDGKETEFVKERWTGYTQVLEKLGVDAVLSACSTVGEFAEAANQQSGIPVYRIDEAMADIAVEKGNSIAVLATLHSTLTPTVNLIRKKAAAAGRHPEIGVELVEGAYEALMSGDKETHDHKIQHSVAGWLKRADVLVLAQASMASATTGLKEAGDKILTSPVPGIMKLKRDLEADG